MMVRPGILAIACVVVIGCASPAPSSSPTPETIQLRFMAADMGCMMAAAPLPLMFRIDPAADEQVIAVAHDGTRYHTWWSEGFLGGTAADPVVRDPAGQVVVRDGDLLEDYTLHGNRVCVGSGSIWVFPAGPA